jgi:hypothetical protein
MSPRDRERAGAFEEKVDSTAHIRNDTEPVAARCSAVKTPRRRFELLSP